MKARNDRLISRWKLLAPVVHDYFGLSALERKSALESARRFPHSALNCYRILAELAKPWRGARG